MRKHGRRHLKFITALPLLLLFVFVVGGVCLEPDMKPENADGSEYAGIKDRLSVSMFFRGELADKIMDAGMQGRLLKLSGAEPRSEVRAALLGWIKENPKEAADLYFYLSLGASRGAPPEIKYSLHLWEINPRFQGLVNALTAAAGDKGLADEALNSAAGRLFEGPQNFNEGPGVESGPAAGGDAGFFSGYADYKLNRAGLEKEMLKLRGWTEALREGFSVAGAPRETAAGTDKGSNSRRSLFAETLADYGAFSSSVSALRARSALTSGESAGLEKARNRLRGKLAALTLLELAARVNWAVRGLEIEDGRLSDEARSLSGSFEEAARGFEAGSAVAGDAARVLPAAGRACAVFCARAFAVRSLLKLRARLLRAVGFSCLYDYLSWRWLERFYPDGVYVKARRALAGGDALLSRARQSLESRAFAEDGGLSLEIAAFTRSLETVEKISAFNKRAQFFPWGLLLRPAELRAYFSGGKLKFKPVFAMFETAA